MGQHTIPADARQTSTTAGKPKADVGEIRRALGVLFEPGDVVELRAPKAGKARTISGYFDDMDRLATAAVEVNRQSGGVYVTMNPVEPALLARRANRWEGYASETTNDTQVPRRRWLLIDADAKRPAGISSTDEEHTAAVERLRQVRTHLVEDHGWPEPVAADSGNGGHLLFRVDLPGNDDGLLQRVLAALDERFSDELVSIDTTVFNPARIVKLYGTVAGKGDHTQDRPHRLAKLLHVPGDIGVLPREKLEALAGPAPEPPPRSTGRAQQFGEKLDVDRYLAERGVAVHYSKGYTCKVGRGRKWVLKQCVWCGESDKSAFVIQFDSGALSAGCQHDRCTGKGWHDFRDAVEPGWRERRNGRPSRAEPAVEPEIPAPVAEPYVDFPTDTLPEPLRGFVIAGSNAIGCDASYIALPLLTALGAAIGNTRRLRVKRGWTVPPILWTAIVGESGTSKTPAFRLALRGIRERQRKAMTAYGEAMGAYEEDLAHWEKAMADWKRDKKTIEPPPEKPMEPHPERCVVSDTTVEAIAPILLDNPRGLLLARDELAGWITSFDRYASGGRGADAAHWLSMHAGENMIVDRKTGAVRTLFVPRAAVSVCGGIQPGILARVMSAEHRESGLLARLLLACPPRRVKRWSEAEVHQDVEEAVEAVVERLFDLLPGAGDDGEPCPVVIGLTPEAKRVWIDHFNAHAAAGVDREGDLAAAWSKLEEVPARLALILHYAAWAAGGCADADNVDEVTLRAAVTLGRWFCREAQRVYDLLSESDVDRDRRRLLTWIERRGGTVTAREVLTGCRWLRSSGAADDALSDLVRRGFGRWQATPTTAKGGRPTRVFTTVSTVSVSKTPSKPEQNKGCADADNADSAADKGCADGNTRGKADPNDILQEAADEAVCT